MEWSQVEIEKLYDKMLEKIKSERVTLAIDIEIYFENFRVWAELLESMGIKRRTHEPFPGYEIGTKKGDRVFIYCPWDGIPDRTDAQDRNVLEIPIETAEKILVLGL